MGNFKKAVSSVSSNPTSSEDAKKGEKITVPHVSASTLTSPNKAEEDKNATLWLSSDAPKRKDNNRRHAI